jgi:hypothetical protein
MGSWELHPEGGELHLDVGGVGAIGTRANPLVGSWV